MNRRWLQPALVYSQVPRLSLPLAESVRSACLVGSQSVRKSACSRSVGAART